MRRTAVIGIAVALLAGTAALSPATPVAAAPADDIHVLVNQARWAAGQPGLVRNAAMDGVAANWATQLAANGTLSHNPAYSAEIPGGWVAAAENVAQGHPSAAAMHDGWMASAGHRANILGDFTDIGIAFLSANGTTWGVEVFAKYPGHTGPGAPAPPPPPAPEAPEAPEPTEPTESAKEDPERPPTPEAAPTAPAPRGTRDPALTSRADERPRGGVDGVQLAAFAAGLLLVAGAGAATVARRGVRPPGRRSR